MTLVDKTLFESRGARGSSDSDYGFAMTTCCERVGVLDDTLREFYWSAESPSRSVSLLDEPDCPFCEASHWDLRRLDSLFQVPPHWLWACDGQRRPGSRRVPPLAESVAELIRFCHSIACPVPAFETKLFFRTSDARLRTDGTWVVQRALLFGESEFAQRFDELFTTGYPWVNLRACGVHQGALIVAVTVQLEAKGLFPLLTAVNYSGPSTPDGTPNWAIDLVVID